MTENGVRRIHFIKEVIFEEGGRSLERAVVRVAALAVVKNPFAGRAGVADLSALALIGASLGERLAGEAAILLGAPAEAYGKAAIVGVSGELEHGAGLIHPRMGKPMRAAVGGGAALIPSNAKVAAAGACIDVPLGHKDNAWSFDAIDTITVCIPDGPRPDEIVVIVALASGNRPFARIGLGPVVSP